MKKEKEHARVVTHAQLDILIAEMNVNNVMGKKIKTLADLSDYVHF